MNTPLITTSPTDAFVLKHAEYSKKSFGDFSGYFSTLFSDMPARDFNIGFLIAGACVDDENIKFIICRTKVGMFMLYEKNNSIYYRCDEEYSSAYSAQEAGFSETSGEVATIEKINHILGIFDSYFY